MRFPRRAGVLLHVSSLPSSFGIGDLGEEAFRFVEFLHRTGQRIWQVLPLGPPARGNSPYTSLSAFAGNPLLISPSRLVEDGLLQPSDLLDAPEFSPNAVDYQAVRQFKERLFAKSFRYFVANAEKTQVEALDVFREKNHWWLDDYALFTALIEQFGTPNWTKWDAELVQRRPQAIAYWTQTLRDRIEFAVYVQFLFFQQWQHLRALAERRGVIILGDMPIFVAHESADVWSQQDDFYLDDQGQPTVIAGVPPDYFSETGQLWDNPLYRWDHMAATGYDWWVKRFRHTFSLFNIVRLDHFRGFESYWEVPASAVTATEGHWVRGPGAAPFRAAESQIGELRIVAEDLGSITSQVHTLRDELGFPGMRVLQFGFDPAGVYHRPDNIPHHCLVYTGTHDNDTTVGWFRHRAMTGAGGGTESGDLLLKYLGTESQEIQWDLIGLAFSSRADTAVVPIQDVLGLGSEARMNTPGQPEGNWTWRYRREMLTSEIEQRLRELTKRVGRSET